MYGAELAAEIARILDEKRGRDINIINVGHMTSVAEAFVVCTGNSNIQVRALADDLEEKLSEQGIKPARSEGYDEARWIAMDYSSVIVHIFHAQEREFYNIERLWMDGSNLLRYPLPEKAEAPTSGE